jgi:isopenicillin-N N-acyltransferase like protein
MAYDHVRVAGAAFARGRAYGAAARPRVQRSLEGYERAFAAHAGWTWAQAREASRRYLPALEQHAASCLDEMAGIAAGAGVDAEDIILLNARTEVMAAAWVREGLAARATDGCSALALLPERTASGHTLVGQNWDWLVHVTDTVVILEAEQPGEDPNYVTAVEAGLLAKTGMNAHGLGLCTNFLLTPDDNGAPGVPYHVTLRLLLDCATVDEARALLEALPRSSSANYLLAEPRDGGRAVDVEAIPGGPDGLHAIDPVGGFVGHTNHFCSAAVTGLDAGGSLMPSSPLRLDRLTALVAEHEGPVGEDVVRAAFADHDNFPNAVCCHPDPGLDEADRDVTAVSILMDLDERRVTLADGNPCTTPYRTLDYSGFLS